MRKIGIVTLNGYYNYGNRLQNYALQTAIESLGYEVETLINDNKPLPNTDNGLTSKLKKIKNKSIKEIIKRIQDETRNIYYNKENNESDSIRTKIFKDFTNNHIRETNFKIAENNIPSNLSDKYSYFVTGSDQVWNPDYIYGSSINFLSFADKNKRISYAPSFGVSAIPEDIKEKYKEWIKDIEHISVREDDGAKIIRELTGREAPVLVDPTLLLSKEKWLSISKEASNKPKEKYLLTYFLGGIPEAYKKQINKIVKENDLKVINLGDIREKETYRTGPSEFIDYINSCSIFCTDSFHGAVFSMIMEKPFIIFEREGLPSTMFSRINTLLGKFNLENRKAENIRWEDDVFRIDYSHVPSILEREISKALDYLKASLKSDIEWARFNTQRRYKFN